jgi:TonB family protein
MNLPAALGRFCFVLAAVLLCPGSPRAQLSKLDEFGERVAAKWKDLGPNPALVKVADFVPTDSAYSPQAHYFAWYLSGSLLRYGKDFLLIGDHIQFDNELSTINHPPNSPWTLEALRAASPPIAADFVMFGTLEKRESSYVVNFRAIRISNGEVVASDRAELHSSEFLESLSAPPLTTSGPPEPRAGVNGVSIPSCVRCPDPPYTDTARAAKINGISVLLVRISPQGTAEGIRPYKLAGYGLDEQAYNAVKRWKFKPAVDKDGNPVSLVVPVEMTFRLN